jgi:predicted nucleic acid-binding protein
MNYSPTPSAMVDANLAVRAILPVGDVQAIHRFEAWHQAKVQIFAPDLWLIELVSTIRQIQFNHLISDEEARLAIRDIPALRVQVIATDLPLCEAAFEWAERLGQSKAYDGFYLALAERLSAEKGEQVPLWTADERLVNRARQVGVNWVMQLSK